MRQSEKVTLIVVLSLFGLLVIASMVFLCYYTCCYDWETYYYDYAPRLLQGKRRKNKKDIGIFELL